MRGPASLLSHSISTLLHLEVWILDVSTWIYYLFGISCLFDMERFGALHHSEQISRLAFQWGQRLEQFDYWNEVSLSIWVYQPRNFLLSA